MPVDQNASREDIDRQRLAALVRAVTLVASEIGFAGLFAYAIYETWEAQGGQRPAISAPVESAAAALAVALAAGCGLTYLANVDETPGLVKTVAIAFGGYVIAYVGAAYSQLSQ